MTKHVSFPFDTNKMNCARTRIPTFSTRAAHYCGSNQFSVYSQLSKYAPSDIVYLSKYNHQLKMIKMSAIVRLDFASSVLWYASDSEIVCPFAVYTDTDTHTHYHGRWATEYCCCFRHYLLILFAFRWENPWAGFICVVVIAPADTFIFK